MKGFQFGISYLKGVKGFEVSYKLRELLVSPSSQSTNRILKTIPPPITLLISIISTMAYHNPLHSQVGNVSSYSALTGAVSGGSHTFASPFRRWLPQPDYSPASKWRAATATDNRHLPAVFFDFIGHSKQGVNMREISVRGAAGLGQMLIGANDPVLASTGLQRITLRIMVSFH